MTLISVHTCCLQVISRKYTSPIGHSQAISITVGLVVLITNQIGHAPATAAEPALNGQTVWEDDFSEPQGPHWSIHYSAPKGSKPGQPNIAVENGRLHFSSNFLAPKEVRGYACASCTLGNGGAGFELHQAPVLQMRLRSLRDAGHLGEMSVAIILKYVTFDGTTSWASFDSFRDAKAGEWFEVSYNLYDDPASTGPAGKRLLKDVNFFLQTDLPVGSTVAMEVDWIRLRQLTPQEYGKISVYTGLLRHFQMESVPSAENFFGLGFYGLSTPRWGGGPRVTLDQLARHGVNFMGAASGRFYQNVWNDHRSVIGSTNRIGPLAEEVSKRANVYVDTHQFLASLLREHGNGFWALDVVRAGTYQITLHRWPAESRSMPFRRG